MWQEEKHPRDNGGKFTDKNNDGLKSEVDNFKDTSLKSDVDNWDKNRVVEFVKSVKEGKPIAKSVEVGAVNDRERKRIEELTGEKLNATKHVLRADEVSHILKRHGENGKADKSMANVKEFAKIEDALHNFDSLDFVRKSNNEIDTTFAYADKNGVSAKLIRYVKNDKNGKAMFVVEALTDTQKGELVIMSAYEN